MLCQKPMVPLTSKKIRVFSTKPYCAYGYPDEKQGLFAGSRINLAQCPACPVCGALMSQFAASPVPIFSLPRQPMTSGRRAPFLPMSRAEMKQLGWDECDIILVTGDGYIDHPSFGMALIGRLLEAQGFRVGIISQPDWKSAEPFRALGRPRLFFGGMDRQKKALIYREKRKNRLFLST